MKGFSIFKNYALLLSMLLFCVIQSNAQQVVDANIINNNGTTELDLIEPTDIDFNGVVLDNQVDLYGLIGDLDGAAQWVLNAFTSSETVYFKLEDFDTNPVTCNFKVDNDEISAYWEHNGNTHDLGSNIAFGSGDVLRIERNNGNLIWYQNEVELYSVPNPNPSSNGMFAKMIVTDTGTQGTPRPNIRFIFPQPVIPGGGTPSTADTRTYTKLKKQLDGSYVQLKCSEINFQYIEDYAITTGENEQIECKLFNWERQEVYSTFLANTYGVNWQNIVVSGGANDPVDDLFSNTYYTLEVTGANKGEKYKLRVRTGDVLCPTPPSN